MKLDRDVAVNGFKQESRLCGCASRREPRSMKIRGGHGSADVSKQVGLGPQQVASR